MSSRETLIEKSRLSRNIQLCTLTATKATVILMLYLLAGLLCFLLFSQGFSGARTLPLVDALYFCVVTMTTVGYGDLVPNTIPSKLFTCAFVFIGFGLIAQIIVGGAANYLVEKQQKAMERVIRHKQGCNSVFDSKVKSVKHKVIVATLLVLLMLAIGVATLILSEGLSFVDAFYCVCVTVTTLGYGDHAFHSTQGRIIAIIWILTSTACVAQFMLYLAEMVTEERQLELARWALSRKVTNEDFERADIDRDRTISQAEFVLYKLKELKKVEEEDIQGILAEFRCHDHDHSGGITIADVR